MGRKATTTSAARTGRRRCPRCRTAPVVRSPIPRTSSSSAAATPGSTRRASWPGGAPRSRSSRRTRSAGARPPATAGSSTPGYKLGPDRAPQEVRPGDRQGPLPGDARVVRADQAAHRRRGHRLRLPRARAPRARVRRVARPVPRGGPAEPRVGRRDRGPHPAGAHPRGDRLGRVLRRARGPGQRADSTRAATSPGWPRPRTVAGADLHEGVRATAIRKQADGRFVVETDRGAILARDVFVATNGYTDGVAPSLRRRIIADQELHHRERATPRGPGTGALAERPLVLRHEELPLLLAPLDRPPDDVRRARLDDADVHRPDRRDPPQGAAPRPPAARPVPHRVRVGRQRRLHLRPDAAHGPHQGRRRCTRSAAAAPASR